MTDLPLGIYEQLVTSDLDHRLRRVDPALVDRDALDPADSHEALARHIARLVRRVLRATGGDGPDALARQVDLTNQITRAGAAGAGIGGQRGPALCVRALGRSTGAGTAIWRTWFAEAAGCECSLPPTSGRPNARRWTGW